MYYRKGLVSTHIICRDYYISKRLKRKEGKETAEFLRCLERNNNDDGGGGG